MVDDDGRPDRSEVREWIHDHSDEMTDLSITWEPLMKPDVGAYARLLEILFAPRPEDEAA